MASPFSFDIISSALRGAVGLLPQKQKVIPCPVIKQGKFPTSGGRKAGCMAASELMVGAALVGAVQVDQNKAYTAIEKAGFVDPDGWVKNSIGIINFFGAKKKTRVKYLITGRNKEEEDEGQPTEPLLKVIGRVLAEINAGQCVHVRVSGHSETCVGYKVDNGKTLFIVNDPSSVDDKYFDEQGTFYKTVKSPDGFFKMQKSGRILNRIYVYR